MTQPPEWTIPCPWCGAAPGTRCTRPSGGHLSIPSHLARKAEYQQQRRAQENRDDTA